MITGWEIYWITRMDDLKDGLNVIGGIGMLLLGIALLICSVMWFVEDSDLQLKNKLKKSVIFLLSAFMPFIAMNITSAFIPTTKEMAMIKMIPAIVNNETIQGECKEIYSLAKQGLKKLVGKEDAQ